MCFLLGLVDCLLVGLFLDLLVEWFGLGVLDMGVVVFLVLSGFLEFSDLVFGWFYC